MDDLNAKLNDLLKKKKQEDAAGLLNAQRDGSLLDYLAEDLKKLGINPADINFAPSSVAGAARQATDVVENISSYLDSQIFSKYHESSSSYFEETVCKQMNMYDTFKHKDLHKKLENVKVMSFIGAVGCALYCLRYLGSNIFKAATFGVLAHDLFVVSSNCYKKTYYSLVCRKLTKNAAAVGKTVFSWLSNQVSSAITGQPPSGQGSQELSGLIKNDVDWGVILSTSTLCYGLYMQVRDMSGDNGEGVARTSR
jgi:hypothetical protein